MCWTLFARWHKATQTITYNKGKMLRSDSYIAQLTRWLDQRAVQSRKWQLIAKSQWCCSTNCSHPIARVNVQLDPRYAASKHTTAPINRTRPSPRKHSPDVTTRARKQNPIFSIRVLVRFSFDSAFLKHLIAYDTAQFCLRCLFSTYQTIYIIG